MTQYSVFQQGVFVCGDTKEQQRALELRANYAYGEEFLFRFDSFNLSIARVM